MDANTYCTYQDITDIIPNNIVGTELGQVTEAQIRRLIIKMSGEVEHWNHDIPFAGTTYTYEYFELIGLDKVALKGIPIISVTSLELEETAGVWSAKTEGRNANTDDFFVEDSDSGIIRFHLTPNKGIWGRITYIAGYAEPPYWLRDLVSKMVAKDIFRLKVYSEECTDLFKYWMDEIRSYDKEIEKYRKKIEKNARRSKAHTMGARWATRPIDELTELREWRR